MRMRDSSGQEGITERLKGEPWIHIADGAELSNWGDSDEIGYNQRNRQEEKLLMFRREFDFLSENEIAGDYHEFGCHRCRTFRMAIAEARKHKLCGMKFWAFDSFEGLPDPKEELSVSKWRRGALATTEDEFMRLVRDQNIYVDHVETVKGFYDRSLTRDRQVHFERNEARIAIATIDCDLYESAVPVFDFIDPLLQEGSIVYIDDLFAGNRGAPTKGVARAFLEYQRRSSWTFLRHLDVGWWGRAYIAYKGEEVPKGSF